MNGKIDDCDDVVELMLIEACRIASMPSLELALGVTGHFPRAAVECLSGVCKDLANSGLALLRRTYSESMQNRE